LGMAAHDRAEWAGGEAAGYRVIAAGAYHGAGFTLPPLDPPLGDLPT
jgi:hypothetical protein